MSILTASAYVDTGPTDPEFQVLAADAELYFEDPGSVTIQVGGVFVTICPLTELIRRLEGGIASPLM